MSQVLVILNDPPYGTERAYNGLRLATSLLDREGEAVRVFLIGDAAACAARGQTVPKGYYNIETMLHAVTRHDGEVGVCGSCMDARGLVEDDMMDGVERSTMDALTEATIAADKTLVF